MPTAASPIRTRSSRCATEWCWRNAGDEALYLTADAPGEHIRFRYLHMNPHMLDLAGLVSGRTVKEGDVLGPVGDYGAREGGTSYHLHFNMQVPTRQGWLFVNPYMTLVASYEHLIGGRGRAVEPCAGCRLPGPEHRQRPIRRRRMLWWRQSPQRKARPAVTIRPATRRNYRTLRDALH